MCFGGNHKEVLGGGTKPSSGLLWWQPRRSSWWEEQMKSRCSVVATMGKFLVEKPNQVQVCCGGNHKEVLGESRRGLGVLWWQPQGSSWWRNQTRFRSALVATTRKFLVEKPNQVQVCCGDNYEEVSGESSQGPVLLWWQPQGDSWVEQTRSRSALVGTTRKFLGRADQVQLQLFSGGNHEEVLGGETEPGSG